MSAADTMALIQRARRDMPRNALVEQLCASCEQLLLEKNGGKRPLTRAEIQKNYRHRRKREAEKAK